MIINKVLSFCLSQCGTIICFTREEKTVYGKLTEWSSYIWIIIIEQAKNER